jgi:hypothetical protein
VAATWGTDSLLLILPFRFREVSLLGSAEHLRFTFRNAIPLASDFKGLGESRVTSPTAQPPCSPAALVAKVFYARKLVPMGNGHTSRRTSLPTPKRRRTQAPWAKPGLGRAVGAGVCGSRDDTDRRLSLRRQTRDRARYLHYWGL